MAIQISGTDVIGNSKQFFEVKGADVASATALILGADGNYFDITGTTTITSIATLGVGTKVTLHFDDAVTLTHHATDLVLPGAANYTTTAGDELTFIEYVSGDWRCVSYALFGTPISKASLADFQSGVSTKVIDVTTAFGSGAEITLTDGALISLDLGTGINFTVTLAGNRTLNNPTNHLAGMTGFIRVKQDATGSRILSFGTYYKFAYEATPTLSTVTLAEDYLFYQVVDSTTIIISPIIGVVL